jgi:dTDP-4-amino-4,6-dideoxygalactose transaminase
MKNEYPMPIPKTPNALKIEAETLRIPCNDVLEQSEIDYVIGAIQKFYEAA